MTRIPTPDTTAATTPDPVLCPGAHLVHRHLADHGHPELLTGGDRAARIQVAFAIRDSAAQLDTDAATLARKLRTLADSVTTLRAGGRLTPARATTPLAALGAEIDLLVHSIDLGTDTLRRHLDTWTQLTTPDPAPGTN
ncbi:hypothetical protein [Streptacidiphilus monticola]|uniref:Uncharacterized protein n=1 Tax=Streptacidiphilus monticola TaxID=2161674 RepID=A0ABW1G955_9ACTN